MPDIKEFLKQFVTSTARNRLGWFVYRTCGRLSDNLRRVYGHARFVRQVKDRDERLFNIVKELFPSLTVSNGPFTGLRYPAAESYGSMLLPKLLGSYESELHPVLERIFANCYKVIVDIGCAEGYYAVGLGLRFPYASIYAYDTSPQAREMCAEMARLNGIQDRIHIGNFCDAKTLRSIPLGDRALIVSDCEGYERVLFNSDMAVFLREHDVIIEAHDFIDIDISPMLKRVFSATHNVESIRSTDDIEKAQTYEYAELFAYTTKQKCEILGERRPGIMRWLVMTTATPSRGTNLQVLAESPASLAVDFRP